jgi:Tfp pilus assembly protein PilF
MTAAAYWRVKDLSYSGYDDSGYVTENAHIQNGFNKESMTWAFTSLYEANWHPLTWLTHTMDYELYGPTAAGHHLTNLAIHVANVVLLFWVLQLVTGAIGRSAFVAALFGVHPLNVESVAWIAERKNVLSTLFFILTIWAYSLYGRRSGWKRYVVVMVLFALGLMSKPMLVTLPFVLLLLDYWPLGRFKPGIIQEGHNRESGASQTPKGAEGEGFCPGRSAWRLLMEKAPLLLMAAGASAIAVIAQARSGAVSPMAGYPISLRLENALVSYAKYLQKMVWPSGLAIVYPLPAGIPLPEVIIAAVVLLTATGVAIWAAGRFKYLTIGWLWYLGTLVPVIGLVQVGPQARADRYAYIPLIGVFIMISWGLAESARILHWPRPVLVAVGTCVLAVMSFATSRQTAYWYNEISVFERARSVTNDNYLAYENLGAYLAIDGQFDKAIAELSRIPMTDPSYDRAQNALGMACLQAGRQREAMDHFKIAIAVNPKYGDVYNRLGATLMDLGQTDEAIPYFHKALELSPNHASAYANLGSAYEGKGELDQAMSYYSQALQVATEGMTSDKAGAKGMAAQLNYRMGDLLLKNGRTADAADRYQQALALDPGFDPARQRLNSVITGNKSRNENAH